MITEKGFYERLLPSADDYYAEVRRLASLVPSVAAYATIYGLLQRLCEDCTADMTFSNLFSRLSYVATRAGLRPKDEWRIQDLRRRCHHPEINALVASCYASDLRILAEFVARVLRRPLPIELQNCLPLQPEQDAETGFESFYRCLRVTVRKWDESFIYGEADSGEKRPVKIDYTGKESDNDMSYLSAMLTEGITLNLLKARTDSDGVLVPQSIIFLPDFLIDVSALASCFMDFGHDARLFLLKRLEGHADNPYSVLGNLVGKFLDELVQARRVGYDISYNECVKRAFANNPIPFAYVELNAAFPFHDEARRQFEHLKNLVNNELEQKYGFDLSKGLLEPSFICEALGISGRMDFLQSDYSKLIEQKSGKRDGFCQNRHKEPHYVQMMLYRAMLEFNTGVADNRNDSYLLYSKYSDGLMQERTYKKLLLEVLNTRNRIVAIENECANGGSRSMLENLSADDLVVRNATSKLWTHYQKPQLSKLLEPFRTASTSFTGDESLHRLTQAYFYRFHTFLCQEHLQGRIATPGNAGRAFSDLWNLPSSVRREQGGLYWSLKVKELIPPRKGSVSVGFVILELPTDEDGFLSNFRQGDIVLLYSYEGEPDVRCQYLMRGRLKSQNSHELIVELNNEQSNREVFGHGDRLFAIEHDYMEAGTARLFSGLYSMLTGPENRRRLLLGVRPPRCSAVQSLVGHYGALDSLVQKERAADELFFVIGPPGSGKTSCAIRSMVEEELRHPAGGKILLMAYTNRAVDELCGMVERIVNDLPELLDDYLRIGSDLSCAEAYRHRLLVNRCAHLHRADAIKELVSSTRVIVGTVIAVSGQPLLLEHCFFDVAFIDEASQLLEPQLLSLLFARSSLSRDADNMAIRKFVLVGDQKQLPAVVLQSSEKSAVTEKQLIEIGLKNCRNSLFERLLSLQQEARRASLYHLLEKQGRMHPQLFRFVNESFYQGRLDCIPLPHQQRDIVEVYRHARCEALSPLAEILSTRRIAFFNCVPDCAAGNDKVNLAEADFVVRCIISLRDLYRREGRRLTAEDIGIIVPYRNQISVIASKMSEYGLDGFDEQCVDTVERYQGSQRDIIFYVFTVCRRFQLAFLASSTYVERSDADDSYLVDRKLNVALTRAREQCFLIGNAALLSLNPIFRQLIVQLQSQCSFFNTQQLYAP